MWTQENARDTCYRVFGLSRDNAGDAMLDKWWSSSQRRINFKYHYGVSRASLYIDYGLFPCDKSGKKSYLIKKTRRQPLVKGCRPVELLNSIVIYASFPRRVTIITMTSCPFTRTITRSRAEFVIFFSTLTVTYITKYVLVSVLSVRNFTLLFLQLVFENGSSKNNRFHLQISSRENL